MRTLSVEISYSDWKGRERNKIGPREERAVMQGEKLKWH
jgi:hypothetical protein